jgi:hypothetical protein
VPLRDRFWNTLLSERTLQVVTFLSIFLVFAAALSFVISGWESFSAPVRVAIPTTFTLGFFGLGWYVRSKTRLYRSGIAISAIAALLIPIDFYTIYINFDVSPDYAPTFWLITSLFCVGAYTLATFIIRSRFFGYLVTAALGSTALALVELGHQQFALSLDWRTASLALLCLCLVLVASYLNRFDQKDPRGLILRRASPAQDADLADLNKGWQRFVPVWLGSWRGRSREEMTQESIAYAFAEPFRNLALLTLGVLLPLTFGWRYITPQARNTFDTLHYALTVNWWIGGLVFGYGAVYYRSRSLGVLAAIALPFSVYLAQAAIFYHNAINNAWHAVGWALLTPLYFVIGYKLLQRQDDEVLHGHGRTASGWGVVLFIVAALWSLTDLRSAAAAAMSHAILAATALWATYLWQRPRFLYVMSLLSFTAMTFTMNEFNASLAQLSIGWATLAIAHILAALQIPNPAQASQSPNEEPNLQSAIRNLQFAKPLVRAAYLIAAFALVPPLAPYNGDLFLYALTNWLILTAWGAVLAHRGQAGFAPATSYSQSSTPRQLFAAFNLQSAIRNSQFAIFHWLTAPFVPLWVWVICDKLNLGYTNFAYALSVTMGLLFALSVRLASLRADRAYRWAWYMVSIALSLIAPFVAFVYAPNSDALTVTLFATGLLYFADAFINRQSFELAPAGLVTAWGLYELLTRWKFTYDAITLATALLVAGYVVGGLTWEWFIHVRRKDLAGLGDPRGLTIFNHQFLFPLYLAAHILSVVVLLRVYVHPLNFIAIRVAWTDEMRLWGAVTQFVLGIAYGLYAWGAYREGWAHIAVWLITAAGGFIILSESTGQGRSAVFVGVVAIVYVLAERGLNTLRRYQDAQRAWRAYAQLSWRLYRRPLLIAGWVASAAAIGLAFVRNLWLLGGGRTQQTWAALGLLLMVTLYALSARLFRRARFVWLATLLVFAPWTMLTNLGWFVLPQPRLPEFAVSWVVLAWALFAINLIIIYIQSSMFNVEPPTSNFQPPISNIQYPTSNIQPYVLPLKTVAQFLLPFSLLWGVANIDTSRITFALAIAFYGFASFLDIRKWMLDMRHAAIANLQSSIFNHQLLITKFLYPAFALIPVWYVYLIAWLAPTARHEHYGLMLLVFGPAGLLVGQTMQMMMKRLIKDAQPALEFGVWELGFGLPVYLMGYVSVIVGTLLVAHEATWLSLALLYDALLAIASARVFRNPLWVYPATALAPLSLWLALDLAQVPANRQGWWLIALAAIYLAIAYVLRRTRTAVAGVVSTLPHQQTLWYACSSAPLAIGFALIALGLPPSSQDREGALWGYGAAALLYAISAFWLRQPLLLTPASALVIVPYSMALLLSPIHHDYYGLILLPASLVALAFAWLLDTKLGAWRDFPWTQLSSWATAFVDRVLGWWALPVYALGFGLAAVSPLITRLNTSAHIAGMLSLNFVLLIAIAAYGAYRFRLRVWLLAAASAGQLAVFYALTELGWRQYPTEFWLRFSLVTLITTGIALFIEQRRNEGSPFNLAKVSAGWSRPLYALVAYDAIITQFVSLARGGTAGAAITLVHALLFAVLASWWLATPLTYVSGALGMLAVVQWIFTLEGGAPEGFPVALAQLTLAYGLVGYGLMFIKNKIPNPAQASQPPTSNLQPLTSNPQSSIFNLQSLTSLWSKPLQSLSLGFSVGVLLLTALMGIDIVGWTVRALFGFRSVVRIETAQMWVGVLSLFGLLYVTTAVAYRRLRFGYAAIALLIVAWMIHAFYVNQWRGSAQVQWYALPAGVYLLAIAYSEWQRGNKPLGRWLDYAAMFLMMGSLFWQTLLYGWAYALLLGSEGIAGLWWGSARRLRRFLYIGMLGIVLATVAQLINALQAVNQWIIFGIIGLLALIIAVVVERKLDDLKVWREVLETWE